MFYGERRNTRTFLIGLDKSGYQVNIFLISPRKHMLRVLIRSAAHLNTTTYVLVEK